jgi:hypothetical protein
VVSNPLLCKYLFVEYMLCPEDAANPASTLPYILIIMLGAFRSKRDARLVDRSDRALLGRNDTIANRSMTGFLGHHSSLLGMNYEEATLSASSYQKIY